MQQSDAMRLAAGREPAGQARKWWPVTALIEAAEANLDAATRLAPSTTRITVTADLINTDRGGHVIGEYSVP